MLIILLIVFFLFSFIIGMFLFRSALFQLSGGAMETLLRNMTSTTLLSFFAGIIITAILQSSSAVMVITVGLVSAKIIRFSHSIGIILGSNIGTTLTLGLFTLDLERIIIPFAVIGLILFIFKQPKIKNIGIISISIAMIFTAMTGFELLANPLTNIPFIQKFIFSIKDEPIQAFLTGAGITSVIQSSTIMTGIAMSMLSANVLSIETSIAIMLGANIGTCFTGLIASIGAGKEAKLTAYAHIWLNVIGALCFLPFTSQLAKVSSLFTTELNTTLVVASIIFNCLCSIIVLPFSQAYARLLLKIFDRKSI